jgi:hypothetical protein
MWDLNVIRISLIRIRGREVIRIRGGGGQGLIRISVFPEKSDPDRLSNEGGHA